MRRIEWLATLAAPAVVSRYTITSANDVPARDPRQWTLSGSSDGTTWVLLDNVSRPGAFESRLQTKSFSFANSASYNRYRLAFTHDTATPNFQLSEIALDGVVFASSSVQPWLSLPSGPAACRPICRGCGTTAPTLRGPATITTNINVQMNYWGAETTDLGDSHQALVA